MSHYRKDILLKARHLRSLGKTYNEIKKELEIEVPKSTLSGWCGKVELPPEYALKIQQLNIINTHKGRVVALVVNKMKRKKLFEEINTLNLPISLKIQDQYTAKIALAMLCLGEATKSSTKTIHFSLGNSDYRIISLFLSLLKFCFSSFSIEKVRCTVQCRADQDTEELEAFWIKSTGIPKRLFYKARIDHRTIGKPTKKINYKGVLRVDYFDNRVWFELESLADLIYNQVSNGLVA